MTVPPGFRGEWCFNGSDEDGNSFYDDEYTYGQIHRGVKCSDEDKMTVDSLGLKWWEQDCIIIKINAVDRGTRLLLDVKCGADGSVWFAKAAMGRGKGVIVYKVLWRGKEYVEK